MSSTPTISMVVDRDKMTTAALCLIKTIDDPTTSAELRDEAQAAFDVLQHVALYNESACAAELAPVGFWELGFYVKHVDERLNRLPGTVKADCALQVMMAKRAAALMDNQSYSVDFRLEAYRALTEVMASLRSAAADLELEAMVSSE